MAVRVVMPREVPCADATRVMWRMWRAWGYSSRPDMTHARQDGWLTVEFWRIAPSACEDTLPSYEWELEEALLSRKVKARFTGSGSWIERSGY